MTITCCCASPSSASLIELTPGAARECAQTELLGLKPLVPKDPSNCAEPCREVGPSPHGAESCGVMPRDVGVAPRECSGGSIPNPNCVGVAARECSGGSIPNPNCVGVMPRDVGVAPPISWDRSVLNEPPAFLRRYAPPLQRPSAAWFIDALAWRKGAARAGVGENRS